MKDFFASLIEKIKVNRKSRILFLSLLLLWIFIICISLIKVPYELITPGNISDTTLSVKVETDNNRGKIGTVSVTAFKPISIIQYWTSYFNNKLECNKYDPNVDLSNEEDTIFGTISKKVGINNAIIVAYEEASKIDSTIVIEKEYKGQIVSAIFPYANNGLQCDDIITKVNGENIIFDEETKKSNFSSLVEIAKQTMNSVTLTVIRKEEVKDIKCNFVLKDDNKYIGISSLSYFEILNTNPKYEVIDNFSTIGSSGGAMLTLSIYNGLLEKDITKGKIIVGTGTIELDNSIGEISGVEQKILTAQTYNVDLFFINNNKYSEEVLTNYEEAIKACKEHNIQYEGFIIPVEKFTDIIEYLNGLE